MRFDYMAFLRVESQIAEKDDMPGTAKNFAAAADEIGRLRTALRNIIDPDPCRYDHNEMCQTHYHTMPCPHGTAKSLLEGFNDAQEETEVCE